MKADGTRVLIPYLDGGKKEFMSISTGSIDRRRLLRGVRIYIRDSFNVKVSNDWIKLNCPITYLYADDMHVPINETHGELQKRKNKNDELYLELVHGEDKYENKTETYKNNPREDT